MAMVAPPVNEAGAGFAGAGPVGALAADGAGAAVGTGAAAGTAGAGAAAPGGAIPPGEGGATPIIVAFISGFCAGRGAGAGTAA
ncbi:MAG TPA: hypothetical protein VIV60_29825, partial [Polyangiaceae bacterium]